MKEIETFKEFFYSLIGSLGDADRRLVSAMLARQAYTPRQVALYLAQDKIEIAAPFLLFSPVLGEIDLKAIARKKGEQYASVIQRRTEIEGEATAGKADAAPKEEARLSQTFLVRDRTNAIGTASDELLALASSGGRLGRKPASAHAQAAMNDPAASAIPAPEKRAAPHLPAARTRELMSIARSGDRARFAVELEKSWGLPRSVTGKLLASESGDEIVYLVRAINPLRPIDLQMILLLAPRYGRTRQSYQSMKALAQELDSGICRMIFNEVGAHFELPMPQERPEPMAPASAAGDLRAALHSRRNALSGSRPQAPAATPLQRAAG